MADSSRRYNLRDTRKKPQGVLLKRWEMEYAKLISDENRRIPLETVKTAIRRAFEDGMFVQWRITLKCPLSGQRIKVPARYADCTHIECFDLEAFLRMKTQKNLLVCPICQNEVEEPLPSLRIDEYIETVLSTMPIAMQVELVPDGSFTKVYEEFVTAANEIDNEEPYVQDSNTPAFDVKQESLEDDDECITLGNDEDEFMEEISVVDMKPISLMPLNIDIKPNISASSELEQIHSREKQMIQRSNDLLAENESLRKRLDQLEMSFAESQKQLNQLQFEKDQLSNKLEDKSNDAELQRKQYAELSQKHSHTIANLYNEMGLRWQNYKASQDAALEVARTEFEQKHKEPAIDQTLPETIPDFTDYLALTDCQQTFPSAPDQPIGRRESDGVKLTSRNSAHDSQNANNRESNKNKVHVNSRPIGRPPKKKRGPRIQYDVCRKRVVDGEKRYKCKQCDYATDDKCDVIKHTRTHPGEKPFKCKECDYAATRLSTLIEHNRLHTGETPY